MKLPATFKGQLKGVVKASELTEGMILKEPNTFLFVSIVRIKAFEGMYFMLVEYFGSDLTQSYYLKEGETVEVFK